MKKFLKKSLIIVLIALFTMQTTTVFAADSAKQKGYVESQDINQPRIAGEITGNGVRIRKTASTSGTVLGLLYKGDVVNVIRLFSNSSGYWAYVKTSNGIFGYVSADYVAI